MLEIPTDKKEKELVVYTAIFIDDPKELMARFKPVHTNLFYHHSTIEYMPQSGKEDIKIGKKHTLSIIGRVRTEKVDSLLVKNEKSKKDYPHITLSTAEGFRPVISDDEIANAVKNGNVEKLDGFIERTEGYSNDTGDVIKELGN